jgi:hypothetical protein
MVSGCQSDFLASLVYICMHASIDPSEGVRQGLFNYVTYCTTAGCRGLYFRPLSLSIATYVMMKARRRALSTNIS